MKINIQSLKFDADRKLLDYIEKKLGRLDRFYDGIVGAEVTLSAENKGEARISKIVKARLEVAGSDLFAEHQAPTFEKAVDQTIDALKRQLVRYKEKLHNE